MATIATLIARIEERIALASGLDVQIHAEGRLLEMLRRSYNMNFDRMWWLNYLTFDTFTVEESTNVIDTSVADRIRRFVDIHSVFYENEPSPMSIATIGTNPVVYRRPMLLPNADPAKVFSISPLEQDATVGVWFRTRLSDEEWEDVDNDDVIVNMDDELLIADVAYDFLVDDGSNDKAAEKYLSQYENRFKLLQQLEHQHPMHKRTSNLSIPTQWTEGPYG